MFWVSKRKYNDLLEKYNNLENEVIGLEKERQALNSELLNLREENKNLTSSSKALKGEEKIKERKISLKDFEKIRGLILKEAEELRRFYNNEKIDYELIRRLLTYKECFKQFSVFEVVGAPKLGKATGLKPSTIKGDMIYLNINFTRGRGYLIDEILEKVKIFLEKKNHNLLIGTQEEVKELLIDQDTKKDDEFSTEILKELEDILI